MDYRERLLKAENQLINAMGFDFMIEHPHNHAKDLISYLISEGEAKGCREEFRQHELLRPPPWAERPSTIC